jgi:hypothetical protein
MAQQEDLHQISLNSPERFKLQNCYGSKLIYHWASNWQWETAFTTVFTIELVAINWYYALTTHGGSLRLHDSIGAFFWCHNLPKSIQHNISTCDVCQCYKDLGQEAIPRSNVAINLIELRKVNTGGRDLIIKSLTIINICTTLEEIIQTNDATSEQVTMCFENCWLGRYPRYIQVIHDQWPEFTWFAMVLNQFQSPFQNPQANAICKRFHGTITTKQQTISHSNPP